MRGSLGRRRQQQLDEMAKGRKNDEGLLLIKLALDGVFFYEGNNWGVFASCPAPLWLLIFYLWIRSQVFISIDITTVV